ncbi:MAG TPA: hypothetical protein VLX92_20655 [Kofleriaceae bacterium]|nr:hypothetical protein [Kofleriaceae bacterium]
MRRTVVVLVFVALAGCKSLGGFGHALGGLGHVASAAGHVAAAAGHVAAETARVAAPIAKVALKATVVTLRAAGTVAEAAAAGEVEGDGDGDATVPVGEEDAPRQPDDLCLDCPDVGNCASCPEPQLAPPSLAPATP